ncbi:LptF/LptG family permease [Neolewinella persica]|uniref:LptF/LptG family permease n=1 Tax=Neolewinella persica TaxID=70998 RepID=UPI0003715607|nr:LptF/LptG family permease [Neolewinella persica]
MPQLDRLLLKSFAGPFLLAFAMAWFVLTMQFLWAFLDKIADKGLGFSVILELIFYRSAGLIPLAIPLAALIASVMVVGGMAERYEWSAFQSAGVSLARLLRPLAFLGLLFVGASYLTSDYLIPAANLHFYQRLADVYQKKPGLSLETGVFNEDLDRFVVYASGRSPDDGHLHNVILYDQQKRDGQINQISAAEGRFFTKGNNENQLFLTLHQGEHYQEDQQGAGGATSFVRTSFRTYTLSFDLSQFDLKEGDHLSGGDHHALLTTFELQAAADSIEAVIQQQTLAAGQGLSDLADVMKQKSDAAPEVQPNSPPLSISESSLRKARATTRRQAAETKQLLQKRRINQELHSRYLYEKHAKLGLAAVCFLFVLVGGATGAIVRKGGFGLPLLLSVGCFITYILLLEFCRRLMKTMVLTGPVAGWIPVLAIGLLAVVLMRRAGRFSG